MTLTGIFYGNDLNDLKQAESWLGGHVGIIAAQTGRANWADWIGSIGWAASLIKGVDSQVRWSIPLIVNNGTLAAGAAHAYDSYYVQAAKTLIAQYAEKAEIIVRTGEEFNGDWMPWAAGGKEEDYVKNYQNFVDAFRSVSDKFKFEWNVNVGSTNANVLKAYPGDSYVDYVGMDFYWDAKQTWSIKDPVAAFNWMKNTTNGLQWLENFAAAHGKETAYSEWGVNSSGASPFIALVKNWFDTHDPAYAIYWNSNADFAGKLSDGSYGEASATYRKLFGVPVGDAGDNLLIAIEAGGLIDGKAGADVLVGGKGIDVFTGGVGHDTFQFNLRGGKDVITDFGSSGQTDSIDTSAIFKAGGKPTLSMNGNDTVITFSTGEGITLQGFDERNLVATATGWTSSTTVTSKQDHILVGDERNLTLVGMAKVGVGNDADNIIVANGTGSALSGHGGNDILVGSTGSDTLAGGVGADTFRFEKASGHDIITDFGTNGGRDAIDIRYYLYSGQKATIFASGSDVIIKLDDDNSIKIVNISIDNLLETSFGYVAKNQSSEPVYTGSSSDSDQLIRLYDSVLGRAPDAGGYKFWSELIGSKSIDIHQAAGYFITSPEFGRESENMSNSDFVSFMYHHSLGRDPDIGGFEFWKNYLEKGLDRASLVIAFSESAEHVNNSISKIDFNHHALEILGANNGSVVEHVSG